METKANLNLKEGTVELAGSEEFVSKYLDIFKEFLSHKNHSPATPNHHSTSTNEVEADSSESQVERKIGNKKNLKSARAKSITIEKFDLHKDTSNLSLEEFLKEKAPGKTTANIIAVIGYYITILKGSETFSEGNVDYAYRTLSIPGRPGHLRQIMINAKNKQDFFEPTDEIGKWKLTRGGEIFVDEKLPPKGK